MKLIQDNITEIQFIKDTDCVTLFTDEKAVEQYDGLQGRYVWQWVKMQFVYGRWASENFEIWRKIN
jgi:hypothetical protein